MKGRVSYSEAFKRGVVEKISRGEYKSLKEASRKNGIQGSSTVERWIKQYGREDLLPKRIKVETMQEIDDRNIIWGLTLRARRRLMCSLPPHNFLSTYFRT